jgi:four helix bundle protein
MDLAVAVYQLTANFPDSERFNLTSQLRRASVGLVSNVAEGHSKLYTDAYKLHLSHARGSSAEIETQILLSRAVGLCDVQSSEHAERLNSEVGRMLTAIIKTLSAKKSA